MDKATHYRARAEEARRMADGINDPEEAKKILLIADDYEMLALETSRSHQRLVSAALRRG